jgi:hypothetical protein
MDSWFIPGVATDPGTGYQGEALEVDLPKAAPKKAKKSANDFNPFAPKTYVGPSPRAKKEIGSFVSKWLDRYAERFCK